MPAGAALTGARVPRVEDARLLTGRGRFVDDIRREDPEGWKRWKSEPVTFAPPEGESLLDFVERIDSTLTTLSRQHPGGTIVLSPTSDRFGPC